MLSGIEPQGQRQLSFFMPDRDEIRKQDKVMETMDRINARWGSNTIYPAAAGRKKEWKAPGQAVTPSYTTSWKDLPVVIA